jgi:hypothetical protein
MKRYVLLLILLLIGCGGGSQPTEPTAVLTPDSFPLSTVVPTQTADAPTALPTIGEGYPVDEGYPVATPLPVADSGYPAPPTPDMTPIDPYPVDALIGQQTVGAGLHYVDEAGVWRVTADGLLAQIVALPGVNTPILSNDGTKLAYMLAGEPAIILLDTISGQITSLTTGTEEFICCVFEWVGDQILAGVQGVDDFGPNIGRLVTFSPDNSVVTISNNLIGGYPSFDSAGRRVAYSDNGGMQLYDLDGSSTAVEISRVIDANGASLEIQNLNFSSAAWSPTDQLIGWAASIVLNGDFQLGVAILNLADNSVQILHPYTAVGMEYLAPRLTWHPTQPLVAFETIDQDESQRGVWLVNYATGEEQFILAGRNPVFSPDGANLAFEDQSGIQIYTLENGSLTLLASGRILDWR